MTVTSAYETISAALIQIINTEFAAEGITAIRDNLHESLGRDRIEVGVAPIEDGIMSSNGLVQESIAEVRFYSLWPQEITPTTIVDPSLITNYAERFRRACRHAVVPGSGPMWYFDVMGVQYPDDPTGNKTRFVARVRGYGNNGALIETTG